MDILVQVIPFVMVVGIFYVLVIRPQNEERDRHEKLVNALAVDDKVVTKEGMHGRVVSVETDTVVLEVAPKTRITFDKASVHRRQGETVPTI